MNYGLSSVRKDKKYNFEFCLFRIIAEKMAIIVHEIKRKNMSENVINSSECHHHLVAFYLGWIVVSIRVQAESGV